MPSSLRDALSAGPMMLVPGAYDALTARLVAQRGFPAVYMTGAGTAVAHGYPDYGLLTMTEMVDNAARMTAAVDIPVIADADTGYGNELNVVRTVRAYARVGVSAIHIEDQTFPKRCGHLAGKEIVDRDAWLRKIRAAVECRPDPGLLIIARTDARAVAGLNEAIERARAALALGADVAFVEAPQSLEEVAAIPAAVGGPCLFNLVSGGRSPAVSVRQLAEWGYRITILPNQLINAVVATCERTLSSLWQAIDGPVANSPADIGGPAVLFQRAGADEWDRLRDRYGSSPGGVSG